MAQRHADPSQSGTRQAKDELKDDARTLGRAAGRQVEDRARSGRDEAVGTARATGSALDRAADEMRRDEDVPDWLASMLGSASNQLQRMAGELDGKEPREMMHTVEDFGRRKPGMFLAASAAVGFAAGRYLRTGLERHDDVDAVEPGDPLGEGSDDRRSGLSQNATSTGSGGTGSGGTGSGGTGSGGARSNDRATDRTLADPAISGQPIGGRGDY
jgi:hypothetical protein